MTTKPPATGDRVAALRHALAERILVLDGAWGTMLQRARLSEAGFRGDRFAGWSHDLRGNYDVLNLVRPDLVQDLHAQYLAAGADIVTTNTFGSTRIVQADYGLDAYAAACNREGARIARAAASDAEERDGRPRWVAGVLGPTHRSASLSPDVGDPTAHGISVTVLREEYRESAVALMEGGADVLLLETVFDTLNAKAAILALRDLFGDGQLPLLISGTIADAAGRNLSGQSVDAWYITLAHAQPLAFGLNCAPGAERMRPYLDDLARSAGTPVSVHPNAGQPDEAGEYHLSATAMGAIVGEWAEAGLVNIAGSCCGSTPEHTRAIAEAIAGHAPRPVPAHPRTLRLAGLNPLVLPPGQS